MSTKVKNMKDQYYTLQEVADTLKISYMTVFRWVKVGKIKSTKIGKQHRISNKQLQDFIKKEQK